jgi:hypothetical protein
MSPSDSAALIVALLWKIASANAVALLLFGGGLTLWGIWPARFKRIF